MNDHDESDTEIEIFELVSNLIIQRLKAQHEHLSSKKRQRPGNTADSNLLRFLINANECEDENLLDKNKLSEILISVSFFEI